MSRTAGRRAAALRWALNVCDAVTDEHLMNALGHLDVRLIESAFGADLGEIVINGHILIGAGLPHQEQRWLFGHAFGHVVLHVGNQVYCDRVIRSRQERAAELFAGYFLIGNYALDPWDAAERYAVPQWRVTRWQALRSGEALSA